MSKPRLLALLTSLSLAMATLPYAYGAGGGAGPAPSANGGAGISNPTTSGGNVPLVSPPGTPSVTGGTGSSFGSSNSPSFGSTNNLNSGSTGQAGGTTPTTGIPSVGVTPNQALTAIQAQGFTDVHNLQRTGNTYTATATQNGEMKQVQVDANTGALIPQ